MLSEEDKKEISTRLDEVLDSALFKTLSEPVRCQILRVLVMDGPLDVGSIAAHFKQDRSVISRHLSMMADAGVLCSEKQSRSQIYRANGQGFLEKLEQMTETVRYLISCKCEDSK